MKSMQLKVGAARVVITPPVGTDLAGFGGRAGPSTGVHDDLYSKCLVFRQNKQTFALVTNDLCGLDRTTGDAIRSLIHDRCRIPPSNVIITCTHTHSGPLADGLFPVGMGTLDKDYRRILVRQIAGCVSMASRNMRKAYLGVGAGQARIGVNRRRRTAKGTIDLRPNPEGIVDEEVGLLKIIDTGGRPLAHLVNYACHPVTLRGNNLLITADYPGVAMRVVEEVQGGIALFTNGCCGDTDPLAAGKSFEGTERLGRMLAGEVIRVSASITECQRPQISISEMEVSLPCTQPFSEKQLKKMISEADESVRECRGKRDHLSQACRGAARLRWATRMLEKTGEGKVPQTVEIKIRALRLGRVVLVAIPGEVFAEIGLAIKKTSPLDFTYVLGYADGTVGYIPTRKALAEGGYETEAYIWYDGLPFLPSVEEVLLEGVLRLLKRGR